MINIKFIKLFKIVGSFAENKDLARKIREEEIIPALNCNQEIILDFKDVNLTTQSFIHALISDLIRKYGNEIIDKINFKNCNETIKKIINIVIDYMQQRD